MKLSLFDYNLPKELIAQYPTAKRDGSRLLVLHKDTGRIEHRHFKDIIEYFQKDDLLVLNNTKVVPSRLLGRKETGGRVEALVLDARSSMLDVREVLLKPSGGCSVGTKLVFGDGRLRAEVSKIEEGRRFLRFESNGDLEKLLDEIGHMPLPPYIRREDEPCDRDRYQTVFASKKGAIAAPTAGLHFTKDILTCIARKGVEIEYVTLHVGYGTFKPVRSEDIRRHKMEKEYFEIADGLIEKVRSRKNRVIAVGTTSCRVLETVRHCEPRPFGKSDSLNSKRIATAKRAGWTDLFIYPPYGFKAVDVLLTNFHLPKTTLLMLVSAFCGRELLMKAYQEAIEKKYRFYSYGDAMLCLK